MSIVSVKKTAQGRTCKKSVDKFKRMYTEKYVVKSSTANVEWSAILVAGGLPTLNTSFYPDDSGALCIDVSGSQRANNEGQFFDLTYTYSSEYPIDQEREQDPLARDAIYDFDFQ